MRPAKEMRKLADALEAQGWKVTKTTKGHYRFVPPDPEKRIVHTGGSPSDHRAFKNLKADLRRQGADI